MGPRSERLSVYTIQSPRPQQRRYHMQPYDAVTVPTERVTNRVEERGVARWVEGGLCLIRPLLGEPWAGPSNTIHRTRHTHNPRPEQRRHHMNPYDAIDVQSTRLANRVEELAEGTHHPWSGPRDREIKSETASCDGDYHHSHDTPARTTGVGVTSALPTYGYSAGDDDKKKDEA
jgi:hypothetical protein